ncbi:hypothetical protein KFZ76_07425 [Methylovulum psychrotolerans]|uniref:hypothetical protein n=1 Tax=Methylovulum psychrotolerans TaxID=1704499 RepID=UPI001BFF5FBE|nr:hypothetical protein [Methylovulum psychrotolerans]MBT9097536.1 hypothetical protein [Methylovulum psychrotolerans]
MPKRLLTALLFILLQGCTAQRVYDTAQGARVNQCTKIADNSERARCYDTATQSYDRYEQSQQPKP